MPTSGYTCISEHALHKLYHLDSGMSGLESQGVYPQSDDGFWWVDIDALKVFVDLWVHLSFAILANFDVKEQLKWLSTKI